MNYLKENELANIKGGAKMIWYALGAVAILIVGIVDGIINPNKCNK